MNILDAITDAEVFAPWFKRGDWTAWRAFLASLFGLPMTKGQLAVYRACTGRKTAPKRPFNEAALVIGRRGGKSFMLALIAVFAATFRDYRAHLQPGERATVMIIAADRKQARVIMRYIVALLEGIPMLASLIERKTTEAVDLRRSVSIEVMTASFRTVRGYSVPVALLDEAAFWQGEDSANPDAEIVAALRPAMATMPGAMMLMASSPYARRGELWRAFKAHHGRDDAPVLVWQAATRVMNPSIPQKVIEDAMAADPASASAEYGAQFRTDVETLLTREAVENCVDPGVFERPPVRGVQYLGFIDPAGGSGADSACVAIAHREDEAAVIDAVREMRPPFSPADMIREFADLLRSYRIRAVTGDRWGGEFVREPLRRAGVDYKLAPVPTSDLYRDLVPIINSGRLGLVDHPRAQAQLIGLERRLGRSGRDAISHAPGAHDDLACVIAGAAVMLLARAAPARRLMLHGPQVREPIGRTRLWV